MNASIFTTVDHPFSKGDLDRAGQKMSTMGADYELPEYRQAFSLINQWRRLQTYPLNTFQANLRVLLKRMKIETTTIIAQRIKRIVSIIAKLQRFETMKLSRMQDIGGIRAIVLDSKSVAIIADYYENTVFKSYRLVSQKNYIDAPKSDGYRSIHCVFCYTSDRYPPAQGLHFEFQIRTLIQHARATAVETVGIFLGQSLKSNVGPSEWLDYFRLVSVGFAYMEGTKIDHYVANKSPQEIVSDIKQMTLSLNVEKIITGFSVVAQNIKATLDSTRKGTSMHLIVLDTKKRVATVQSFLPSEKDRAFVGYQNQEQDAMIHSYRAVVLVSTEQIKNLEKAYPSFFGDNKLFLEYLGKLGSLE